MEYHPVVYKIKKLLTENKFWHETFEHAPVRTSEEAAKLRTGYSINQGAKALIVRVKITKGNKKFAMLVVPGNMRFDISKVKEFFGAKDIRFATEAEVMEITGGVKVGGVPPFGNLFGLEVVADPKLFENEKIVFNAGDRQFSIGMKSQDYRKIVNPKVADIT
ncbi:MAG: YbaK/EbsC family protein [bacterium]